MMILRQQIGVQHLLLVIARTGFWWSDGHGVETGDVSERIQEHRRFSEANRPVCFAKKRKFSSVAPWRQTTRIGAGGT